MKLTNLKSDLSLFRGEVRNWAGNDTRDQVVPYRAWYFSAEWRQLRAEAIHRDQGMCGICKVFIPAREPIIVDHIVPHRGNRILFFNLNNLQCSHKACHDGQKQKEERLIPLGTEEALAPPAPPQKDFVF